MPWAGQSFYRSEVKLWDHRSSQRSHAGAARPFSSGSLTLLLVLLFVPGPGRAPARVPRCAGHGDRVSGSHLRGPEGRPAYRRRHLVWSDARSGAAAIYSYDLAAQSESLVAGATGELVAPTVSDGAAFWTDLSAADPMVAGLDPCLTPPQVAVGTDPGEQPAVDGDYVVFTDLVGGASHIYGYNRDTQQVFPICTATGDQTNPAVSGDLVAWQDDRNGKWDIYGST